MINVSHLTHRVGDRDVLRDVGFVVYPGTVAALVGAAGSGKSTVLRALVGLVSPTSGTATVLGMRYRDLPNPGRDVGVLLGPGARYPGRTGREVLSLGARLLDVRAARVERLLQLAGLSVLADDPVTGYTPAQRRRLGLAHVLLGCPQVLLLDEPTAGLDMAGRHWLWRLLRDFADDGGTVLLTSSEQAAAEAVTVADQVLPLAGGRLRTGVAHR